MRFVGGSVEITLPDIYVGQQGMNVEKAVFDRVAKLLQDELNDVTRKISINQQTLNTLAFQQAVSKRDRARLDSMIRELRG